VDRRSDTLLLPIYGRLVPFHVATVKTITLTTGAADVAAAANADGGGDGEQSSVKVVFNVPGSFGAEGYQPAADHPDAVWLKELSFRCRDASRAARVVTEVKGLQRAVRARDRERAESGAAGHVTPLRTLRSPKARLPDLWLRPALAGRGRKVPGVAEVHANGLRYSTPRSPETVDVTWDNVKHAFFQPAQGEAICLLHFRLHEPILVNKKRTADVQLYAEVVDAVQAGRPMVFFHRGFLSLSLSRSHPSISLSVRPSIPPSISPSLPSSIPPFLPLPPPRRSTAPAPAPAATTPTRSKRSSASASAAEPSTASSNASRWLARPNGTRRISRTSTSSGRCRSSSWRSTGSRTRRPPSSCRRRGAWWS